MKNVFKKIIKEDENKSAIQTIVTINKENDISFAIAEETNKGVSARVINLSFNQICSLSRLMHKVIDSHYQQYSNTITKEKTQTIYIDDPIDW